MDHKERELERKINKIKATLEDISQDKQLNEAERTRRTLLWEAELTREEERLHNHRLEKFHVLP